MAKQPVAHFYIDFVEDEVATELTGRPVVKPREMISIVVDPTYRLAQPVTEKHIRDWPEVYRQFKAALPEDLDGGVELRNVPGISLKREEELRRQGVLFVEQLLVGSDAEAVKKWGPDADKLRQAAIAYMRGDTHPAVTGAAEAKKPDGEQERLREELARRGVRVDKRWGVKRLRAELEATGPADTMDDIQQRLAAAL